MAKKQSAKARARAADVATWRACRSALTAAIAKGGDVDLFAAGTSGWMTPSGWYALRVPGATMRGQTSLEELDSLLAADDRERAATGCCDVGMRVIHEETGQTGRIVKTSVIEGRVVITLLIVEQDVFFSEPTLVHWLAPEDAARRAALAALTRQSEELGGYDVPPAELAACTDTQYAADADRYLTDNL